jgi:4-amino-4-deoxy-L-arabinose transferase-like glycosyltransferase
MARSLGTVLLLLTLVVIAWMLTAQQSASNRKQQAQAVDHAQATANGVAFEQAQAQLEQQHALNGTYAGTSLAGFGVTLVRADASTYCIQNAGAHLAGPGGTASRGPC